MEIKKSPKADLEGKKSTWLLVGLVLTLAVHFVAFEWTERDKKVTTDTGIVEHILWHGDNGFNQIVLNQIAPGIALAAPRISGKDG